MSHPILITGFNPFAGAARNPSQAVVEAICSGNDFKDVHGEVLPTEFDRAGRRVVELLDELKPKAWIGLGLHEGATGIVLERRAVNLDDARIPDNAGEKRTNRPIVAGGPESLPSTLPVEQIAADLTDRGIPVTFSDSAGRFVCNHVFYTVMSVLQTAGLSVPAGFIHLPWPIEWGPVTARHEVTIHDLVAAAGVCIDLVRHGTRIRKI